MEAIFESLKGKKVFITGSSRGIGKALALAFAQNGADIVVHGIKPAQAMDETFEEVKKFGTNVIKVCGDLSDTQVPKKLFDEITEKLGGVDILICNASLQIRKPWIDISDEEMQQQIQVNFISTLKLIQFFEPNMEKNGWGRIITIGSTQQSKPHPDMLVYSSTKDAVYNSVKSLALQLARKNITVNNVAPGTIYTDRNTEVLKDPEYFKKVEDDIPIHRIGEPLDCVGAVLMLASNAGSYITGENLYIDGGKFI